MVLKTFPVVDGRWTSEASGVTKREKEREKNCSAGQEGGKFSAKTDAIGLILA